MKMKMSISKTTILALIVFITLSLAAMTDNRVLHVIGVVFFIGAMLISNINESFILVVIFTPNLAIVTLSNGGLGLIGLLYLVLFIKCIVSNWFKIKLNNALVIPFIYLILVSIPRLIDGNIYDLLIIIEVLVVLLSWKCFFYSSGLEQCKGIYNAYCFGCYLMTIGMIINTITSFTAASRMTALLDDANFTSMAYIIMFASSLVVYSYKLEAKHPIINIIVSVLGGAATGSRGFLLSLGVVVFLFALVGIFHRKERKATVFFAIITVSIFVLYLVGVKYIVDIYNNTIGRTFDLRNSYVSGTFMDVTSGRLFLWEYYLEYIKRDCFVLLFGRGFYNYYLVQNGGYFGMAAHNSYIASVIGIGVIGTFLLFVSYLSFLPKQLFKARKLQYVSFISVFIGTAVGFFFLDGILDIRLITSIVMTLILYRMYLFNEQTSVNNGVCD